MFAGVILYAMFEGIVFFFMMVFRHPLAFIFIMAGLYAVASCAEMLGVGSVDIVQVMRGNATTIREWSGNPEQCSRSDDGSMACNYGDFGDVVFAPTGRISQITYTLLDYRKYDLNEDFYKVITRKFGLPYREPDFASVNEMRWTVPGTGVIRVTSDDDMNVDKVVISAR